MAHPPCLVRDSTDSPSRCFYFTGSTELAWHNNLYRAFIKPVEEGAQVSPLLSHTAFEH
jgi:bifunctional polynucleotide phosphatase/kinase